MLLVVLEFKLADSTVLVCHGLQKGQVRVDHYAKKKINYCWAHDSSLACFGLMIDGKLICVFDMENDDNRKRAVDCGVVPILLRSVECGLERGVEVIGLLVKCKEGREQLESYGGCVKILVHVLRNGSSI
ncbi:hypothetical protein P8452_41083 [Trifolium repens]|nr:hypothetical protein P8452_41083 [Trifolium repens]